MPSVRGSATRKNEMYFLSIVLLFLNYFQYCNFIHIVPFIKIAIQGAIFNENKEKIFIHLFMREC